MISSNDFILCCTTFSLVNQILSVSYNQPKFCPLSTWKSNGITFANNNTVGSQPYGIFVDISDTIYVTDRQDLLVRVWSYGSLNPTRILSDNLTYPRSLCVTTNGDVYVDNGDQGRVDKWSLNATNSKIVMNFSGICFGLFVDVTNNLYCSVGFGNQVQRISLNNSMRLLTILAGNGTNGSTASLLNNPRGIFVDVNLNLYVADSSNSRIQLFRPAEMIGRTVAGNGASGTFTLITPHDITLDGDGYLYIVDSGNSRIIGSGPNGFRCLIGCNGKGSTANKLSFPQTMAFDSYGNIFVTDRDNNRIQKFILATNSCKFTTAMSSITTIKTKLRTKSATVQMTEGTIEPMTVQTTEQMTDSSTMQMTESTIEPTTVQVTEQMTESSTMQMNEQIIEPTTVPPLQSFFVPPICSDTTRTGPTCNISNMPCDILKPCQNNGVCNNTNMTPYGYQCLCSLDVSGIDCEINHRLCDPNPCWNDGQCNVFNTTFTCTCASGWQDRYCQTKINYCKPTTCMNNGVCQPLLRNYTCECLSGSFYGYYCQSTTTRVIIYRIISQSFAYIAILAMTSVAIFIIVMDVLKYCFGIDPTRKKSKQIRSIRPARQKQSVAIRPSINVVPPSPSLESSVTIEELSI